jgi:hypothetical protein
MPRLASAIHDRAKGRASPADMNETRREPHTTLCCAHPYFGFVCPPNAVIDFSDCVPREFGHTATAIIDRNGFRNVDLPEVKPDDEFWIGVFGGSVAFGVPATSNAATVAGCLERRLQAGTRPGGRRVRVINFAILGGQQPQQMFVLLLNRHRLDGVITFDGVNEVLVPSCYNKDYVPPQFPYRPYYELLYGQAISDDQICEAVLLERATAGFYRRPPWQRRLFAPLHRRAVARHRQKLAAMTAAPAEFRSVFGDARAVAATDVAVDGARNWAESVSIMHTICRAQTIQALFVAHPIPDREKPLTDTERTYLRQQAEIVAIRAAGYDRVLAYAREMRAAGLPVVSFEDVFSTCTESIYTDVSHFEDRGSVIVADRLADVVSRTWAGFAA